MVMRRRLMTKQDKVIHLLDNGQLTFNSATINITRSTRYIDVTRSGTTDAYNVYRSYNLTDFSANVTTGTGNNADVLNKPALKTILAGSTCTFSLNSYSRSTGSASGASWKIRLRSPTTSLAELSFVYNSSNIVSSVTWTQETDADISCVAVYSYHLGANRYIRGNISLLVDGVEYIT